MAVVALPCDRSEEWSETQKFILLLSQSKCVEDLSALVSSHGTQQKGRDCMLRALLRYTKSHCTPKEQSNFFKVVLPGVCRLAAQLPELCPAEGIPFVRAQEGELCVAVGTGPLTEKGLCSADRGRGGLALDPCLRVWVCGGCVLSRYWHHLVRQ